MLFRSGNTGQLWFTFNFPVLPGDDRLCDREWLTHPLKYVRSKQRWKQRMEEEATPVVHADPAPTTDV